MRILVVLGGQSPEHDVSVASGLAVAGGLLQGGHEVTVAYIDRRGAWRATGFDGPASQPDPSGWPSADPWSLLTDPGSRPQVVMAALHGPLGEDGVIAALAQLADVACVGSGLLGSAVCMDKTLTREVLEARGIAQTAWLGVHPGAAAPSYPEAAERLGSQVLFVKPANLGSSIGITRVTDASGWQPALTEALGFDDTVIIEAAVDGRELSVSILGNRVDGYDVSEVSETTPHGEFLDHADKYGTGAAMAQVPADIDPDLRGRVCALGPVVADALRVDGLARVDLFVTDEGALLVNEVNTMPGFTTQSTFPRMWAASGVEFPELLDRLCHLAVQQHQRSRPSSAVTVREASEADWQRIGELTVEAYASVPGRPRMAEYDRELADTAARARRDTLLVAEDGEGHMVGAVGYSLVSGSEGRVGRARQVAVATSARGQGVGRALMDEVMARLRGDGVTEMVERTAAYMSGAQALYRSAGFVRAPDRDETQADGPPLVAFRRYL